MNKEHYVPLSYIVTGFVLVLGFLTALPAAAQEDGEDSQIDRVVLYKNGMAFFQRSATVEGEQEVTLQFSADQMEDVLPTFYAVDRDGGRISSINYESEEPLERRLEKLLVSIPNTGTERALIKQLQGVQARFSLPDEDIRGKILGIQTEKHRTDDEVIEYASVSVMTGNDTVRRVDLRRVSGFKVLDENIQEEIAQFLQLQFSGKQRNQKSVTIRTTGEGERTLEIGYSIPAPVWKSSYRLHLGEEETRLQGWATVENQTSEDWEDVAVQLVAGNPISFKLDMYSPFYPERERIPIATLFPEVRIAAMNQAPGDEGGRYGDAARRNEARGKAEMEESIGLGGGAGGSFGAAESATARSIGETFQYNIDDVVSIPRGSSSLVPILNRPVSGHRMVYWNPDVSEQPLNGFYLENTTGTSLDRGQVTVYSNGTSLGEALLNRVLKPGMEEILTYAVESGVSIRRESSSEERPIQRLTIQDGVIYEHLSRSRETTYYLENNLDETKTVYLDHERADQYELEEPSSPEEQISDGYRFALDLEPNRSRTFTVREIRNISNSRGLQSLDSSRIQVYLENVDLTEEQSEFFREVQNLRGQITDLQEEKESKQSKIEQVQNSIERFRRNIESLGQGTNQEQELRSEYINRMSEAENQLESLQEEVANLNSEINSLQSTLRDRIRAFSGQGDE